MVKAVVVYESMFGNTRAIAEAVAAGLAEGVPVEVVGVAEAPTRDEGDGLLLVVGGPTHAFSLSRQSTRDSAREQGGTGPSGVGLREWLESLDTARGAVVATFDTRINKKFLPGSAAHSAEKRLRKLGYRAIAPAESFWVSDTAGPLIDGELERARAWGVGLAAAVGA